MKTGSTYATIAYTMTTLKNTANDGRRNKHKKSLMSLQMPKGVDLWIMSAVVMLAIYGILMVSSASMGKYDTYSTLQLLISFLKPAVYAFLGFLIMCWMTAHFRLDFFQSRQRILMLIVVTGALLLFCLCFSATNSAKAWIKIPIPGLNITLQPSEFAKISAMMIIAFYLGDRKKKARNWLDLLSRPLLIIGAYCLIVMGLQNDTGSAIVIFLITCVCMLIPHNSQLTNVQTVLRMCFWLVVILLIVMLVTPQGAAILESLPLQEYQIYRFTSAINPFADEHGYGYQLISGLSAFASGGLFGRGYGNSIRKYMNFPQAESDYILSILVEELGFAGFAVLLALYLLIVYRLLYYALKIRSEKARILLVGTSMYFVFHIFLNIGGVTGLIPLTGVPLPLISAGGSSTLSVMTAVGICQALIAGYRNGEIE